MFLYASVNPHNQGGNRHRDWSLRNETRDSCLVLKPVSVSTMNQSWSCNLISLTLISASRIIHTSFIIPKAKGLVHEKLLMVKLLEINVNQPVLYSLFMYCSHSTWLARLNLSCKLVSEWTVCGD